MKFKTILSTFILCSSLANAEPSPKQTVFSLVKSYALATACQTTFEESESNNFGKPSDDLTYVSYTTINNVYIGMNNYYVLWGGYDRCDIAATGENFTYKLTEVKYEELANRYIIKEDNKINTVTNEEFFTLGNLESIEQKDDSFILYLYMFNKNDIDSKTGQRKNNTSPRLYKLTLIPDYSEGEGSFKVSEKVGF